MNFGDIKAEHVPKVVMLISGSGSNMAAIVDSLRQEQVAVEFVAVISNNAQAAGLQKAAERNIPTQVLSNEGYSSRDSYDADLIKTIADYQPDLIVLAGFMRILSECFVRYFEHKIVNIHPALLPQFKGLNTHQRALDAGVQEHGATVHFIDENLDEGFNIIQAVVPVLADDNADSLQQRVLSQEHIIYPIAVKWYVEGRLKIRQQQVLLDGQPLPSEGVVLGR